MGDGAEPLVEALFRNVYMGAGDRSAAEVLERYVVRELLSLQLTDREAVLSGRLKFSADHLQKE